MLLNIFGTNVQGRYTKLFLSYATYYACREIFLHWRDAAPPTVSWCSVLNSVLPLYRIAYLNRNCPSNFDKIWSGWIAAWGSEIADDDLGLAAAT